MPRAGVRAAATWLSHTQGTGVAGAGAASAWSARRGRLSEGLASTPRASPGTPGCRGTSVAQACPPGPALVLPHGWARAAPPPFAESCPPRAPPSMGLCRGHESEAPGGPILQSPGKVARPPVGSQSQTQQSQTARPQGCCILQAGGDRHLQGAATSAVHRTGGRHSLILWAPWMDAPPHTLTCLGNQFSMVWTSSPDFGLGGCHPAVWGTCLSLTSTNLLIKLGHTVICLNELSSYSQCQ